ncbi:pirin family protein [Labrys wisconsinensis]|uniref:Redox-sensitive bicupin YhaK (Pirin superfamily) n=1 Tax=Labrys wisconsinensis TaxID=425677 RepID=A0ABU0JFA5_9HYPH|nr:pirin family protein [Labrys wisconsinensis]MDQ0472093.1 redox-sensitive bicupin YhaK (pirin superfamily) [Labrys wisconsinensis]
MIERRPFDELPGEDLGWLKARHHFSPAAQDDPSRSGWGCIRGWNDEEIAPNAGFALQVHADIEIIIYVREGIVTHRDSLGNEGRLGAGNVQVVSAGTGIRHAEYNLEQASARIFQIWITPTSSGGSPAWGAQPCPATERSGCFVAIASGLDGDHDALPIRACARVLNARLKGGESIEHGLGEPRLAYLVPSFGTVDVNGVRIHANDGAAIRDIDIVTITAIEDADVVMVDILQGHA